jgi:ring-1,2-phenylacetyl-CoA epoxidase subunit PaaD
VVISALNERPAAANPAPASLGTPPTLGALWAVAAAVPDPEIPVISVADLGILRGIEWDADDPATLVVTVTPTYSGCPATEMIMASLREALAAAGVARVRIETHLSPPWTTDWMTADGKRKLAEFGIAPPGAARATSGIATIDVSGLRSARRPAAGVGAVACPRCGSKRTQLLSQFGSTACKAHYRCLDCLEPFDHFKPH